MLYYLKTNISNDSVGRAEECDSGKASIQPEPFHSYHYGQMCFAREELFLADASAEFC